MFVHPQIKLNNLDKVVFSLFKRLDFKSLKEKLSLYFPEKQFILTDMGRIGFRLAVENLGLENSEILMPAYICDIFQPILKQYNIKPIFLDIDLKTFNLRVEEIENKITSQTKAVLISHTYGLPNEMDKILFLAKSYNLKVIEDCAHSFGAKYGSTSSPQVLGNFGDVAFFSLYKQFPTLRGGLLVCPQDWQVRLPKTRFNFRDFISLLNCFSFFAWFFKKFGGKVAPKMLRKEKLKKPAGLNHVSLNLFSSFCHDFEKNLAKRKELALFFQEELKKMDFQVQEPENNVFCFLSALIPDALREKRDEFVKHLRKKGIFCTRIWHTPIILNKQAQREYNIDLNEFPNTIEAAKRIINFPLQNFYNKKDIEKMIDKIKKVIAK